MLNKTLTPLFYLFFIIALSSCRTYLTPAILGNNMGYLPKAMGADSIKTLTNVSLSYAGASSPDSKVAFELGMANISQSRTFKTANISYGMFAYTGNSSNGTNSNRTEDTGDYLPSFKKSIQGVGFRFSAGLHHTSKNGNTDFRFINFENALSFEGGDYTGFRNLIYNSKIPNYVAVTNRKAIWTTGLSTEVIWRARRDHDIKHAFRLFIGGTPGLASNFKYGSMIGDELKNHDSGGWIFNYFLYMKRFTLTYEVANSVNLAQKISFGYSFH